MQLSRSALADLGKKCDLPTRDLAAQRVGIVHLGPGAFHRAHQALATEICLEAGQKDWAICGVSLRSASFSEQLTEQHGLYGVLERGDVQDRLRVIGAIDHALSLKTSWDDVLRRLVDPDTKIVTLTITEKGYGANLQTRKLDISDPDIAYDLSNPKNAPRSVVGVLTRAITQRAVNKTPQFTCLSCDNLSHNGTLLKSVLMNFAQHTGDAALVGIVQSMSFPSSMVDRITPATTASDIDFVSDKYGVSDKCLVVAEPFFQWVIQDDFPMGRPDWTLAGAEFVSDVTAHEKMKLRMLNGAHSILAAIGQTLGARTIAQTVRLPDVENFVSRYWSEVAKTVSDDLDTHSYAQQLLARFQNSALEHRVDQIASDVSKKIQQRLVPPFREFNSASDVIGLGLAIVIRACGLRNDVGDAIHFSDPEVGSKIPRLDFSKQLSQDIIAPYLGNEVETNQVMHWLGVLQRDGLAQTLRRFNQNMT